MGREEIGRWLAFLRPSSNAVELQLSKVPIEDVDQQELSESLKSNQFLQSLWLTGNELTAEGARALGEGIASNQSLRTLRINYNGRMGVEGVEHIMMLGELVPRPFSARTVSAPRGTRWLRIHGCRASTSATTTSKQKGSSL
eukprot:g2517.t1